MEQNKNWTQKFKQIITDAVVDHEILITVVWWVISICGTLLTFPEPVMWLNFTFVFMYALTIPLISLNVLLLWRVVTLYPKSKESLHIF